MAIKDWFRKKKKGFLETPEEYQKMKYSDIVAAREEQERQKVAYPEAFDKGPSLRERVGEGIGAARGASAEAAARAAQFAREKAAAGAEIATAGAQTFGVGAERISGVAAGAAKRVGAEAYERTGFKARAEEKAYWERLQDKPEVEAVIRGKAEEAGGGLSPEMMKRAKEAFREGSRADWEVLSRARELGIPEFETTAVPKWNRKSQEWDMLKTSRKKSTSELRSAIAKHEIEIEMASGLQADIKSQLRAQKFEPIKGAVRGAVEKLGTVAESKMFKPAGRADIIPVGRGIGARGLYSMEGISSAVPRGPMLSPQLGAGLGGSRISPFPVRLGPQKRISMVPEALPITGGTREAGYSQIRSRLRPW